jgi:DNA (cytosine-5)-methyltransferase 1
MKSDKKGQIRFVDLFSGIGGFRVAIDKLGGKSLGYSEIDIFAKETYNTNFGDPDEHDLGDVRKIEKLPEIDLITGGVPCQSWSVAGKRLGFKDPRGQLWFDTIRTVKISKPKVFIFENVKGLADPRNLSNLNLIKSEFNKLGYTVFSKVLNTFDFGQPQNRSRIFIVGFRNDLKSHTQNFEYPEGKENGRELIEFLDGIRKKNIVKNKFSIHALFEGKVPLSRNASQKIDEFNDFFVLCDTRNGHTTIHSWDIRDTTRHEKEICMAILRNRRKKKFGKKDGNPLSLKDIQGLVNNVTKKNIDGLVAKKILKFNKEKKIDLVHSKNSSGVDEIYRVYLPNSRIFSTLTATGTKDYIATEYVEGKTLEEYRNNFIEKILRKKNLRQVTPKEASRIQGFPDDFKIHKIDRHANKQIGNSVSPIVVEEVVKKIIDTGVFDN